MIKEFLICLLLKNGFRSRNHECLVAFFYHKYPQYESQTILITKMKFLRNRLNYFGELIPYEFFEDNHQQIYSVIELLRKLTKDS